MSAKSRFRTDLTARNLARSGAIGAGKGGRRRKKKKGTKQRKDGGGKRNKKGGKMKKEEKTGASTNEDGDIQINISASDPMKKLYAAHPRHIIKLVLKKLCCKPQFYRMLGTLGMALKSSGISLTDFFLSSNNKLPKEVRNKLRYDVNDQRMLILARLAIHKMLIREGTKLRSTIHSHGTYPSDHDSDEDDVEINQLPPQHRSMKKGLKYISNDKFADKMQIEDPQDILNALSFADKHSLYQLLKQELDQTRETEEGGLSELHKQCTSHVRQTPSIQSYGQQPLPTILKHDDDKTWPQIQYIDQQQPMMMMGNGLLSSNGMGDDDEDMMNGLNQRRNTIDHDDDGNNLLMLQSESTDLPNTDMMGNVQSNFTAASAKSIYNESEYTAEDIATPIQRPLSSRRSLLNQSGNILAPLQDMQEEHEMDSKLDGLREMMNGGNVGSTQYEQMEYEAEQRKYGKLEKEKNYKQLLEKEEANIDRNIRGKDHDQLMTNPYQYENNEFIENEMNGDVNEDKDISLLSCLQTQIDILVRYNHIGYKHLSMLLMNKPSSFPEMYISLEAMREWELDRDNEIEILQQKQQECKDKYGKDIDELNIRKALLAREINETKVSLERIKYELIKMRKLYENAKIELDEVNETTKQQELQRDAYLTKFDEKWTFEWGVRDKFHKQSSINAKIKMDAKHWSKKLEQIKQYNDSEEIWQRLKGDIWKFGNDNKKMADHYKKLNKINKSRTVLYNGCIKFWNHWYFKHCQLSDHLDDKNKLEKYYKDIMLKGTKENIEFDFERDTAQFEYELSQINKQLQGEKINIDDPNTFSYRQYIYNKPEQQIDITATELDIKELWRLVEYQEKNDFESYKQFAYPKWYQFEQEQLEMERKEKLRDIQNKQKKQEKRKQSKSSKHSAFKGMTKKKSKMNSLQEVDDEDIDDEQEQEKQYQSQMQFAMMSQPGTPYAGMGMSAKFHAANSHAGSMNNFQAGLSTMSLNNPSNDTQGTYNMGNMGGMSVGTFGAGMSTGSINGGMMGQSSAGITPTYSRIASMASGFGRQGTQTHGVNTPTFSNFGGGVSGIGGLSLSGRPSGIHMGLNSASGMYGMVSTPKNQNMSTPTARRFHGGRHSGKVSISGIHGINTPFTPTAGPQTPSSPALTMGMMSTNSLINRGYSGVSFSNIKHDNI